MYKIKALLLGHSDSLLVGHAFHAFHTMPNCYDKRIVLHHGSKENLKYSLHQENSIIFKFIYRYRYIKFKLKTLLQYGEWYKINPNKSEHFFLANEDISETADAILKKCGNFTPEIIFVYWVSEFVSYKTLRKLHEKTGAFIVIMFVDQAPLSGGCHYPVDCEEFKTGCQNCPALLSAKKIASYNINSKIEALKSIPHAIVASAADISLAKRTKQFKDSIYFEAARIPDVVHYNKHQARIEFGIEDDEFVILLGAQNINDVRKGIKYGLEAIKLFCEQNKNVTILALGESTSNIFENIDAKIIQPGFLSINDMFKAYCAADCYLNTTIADSGPMMVNYALSLGIPTISFPIGMAMTMVKDGETGYISEYKNSADMAKNINKLYSKSTNERLLMRENCIKLAKEISRRKPIDMQIYDYYIRNILCI